MVKNKRQLKHHANVSFSGFLQTTVCRLHLQRIPLLIGQGMKGRCSSTMMSRYWVVRKEQTVPFPLQAPPLPQSFKG